MASKWFQVDPSTQKVSEFLPSQEKFALDREGLLYWTRGLSEWVPKSQALAFFQSTPQIPQAPVVTPEKPTRKKY